MSSLNKFPNAGVHGTIGFEFQKHCALFMLFDRYEILKQEKFFICLEHHDDLIFCYLTDDEIIVSIDAYQAKKSSKPWNQSELYEILKKMAEVGTSLKKDEFPKIDICKYNLEFITNNTINLTNGRKEKNQNKSHTINEITSHLKMGDLDQEVIDLIKSQIKKSLGENLESLKEIDNISMSYIDLPKDYKHQKDSLVGHFGRIFGNTVNDHRAAVETLLLLFRDVENTLNNGNIVKLMDSSKRVSSGVINETLDIITTKKMAFDFWRGEEKEASRKLEISIFDKKRFELDFINSIDRFKDKKQTEHQKIISFVKDNRNALSNFTDDVDCIKYLYEKFQKDIFSTLPEINTKAAIFAAYLEVREELWG